MFRRYSFDRSGRQTNLNEFSMSLAEIFHHQIERRIAGCDLRFGYQNQMSTAAKLKHRYLPTLDDRAHT